MTAITEDHLARWRRDPIAFIEEALRDPETGRRFKLNPAQRRFVRRAFKLTKAGRLPYPELVFSGPKKSGKTTLAAMMMIYVVLILGPRFAEGVVVANDLEQAVARVFQAVSRIVEASFAPGEATVTSSRVEFRANGGTITAIASDYAGAAGGNANIVCFDELWAFTSERSHRLWDEMVPPPTRKVACRLTTTYSGFEGESELLQTLHRRGLKGKEVAPDLYEQAKMLMFWTERFTAPWQTKAWREQMREQLRPNAYLRMIENKWVSSESSFVELEWWDACVDPGGRPVVADRGRAVWLGVDASVKRDSTAIVAVTWDAALKKVRLVAHKVFQPSAREPLDFEQAVEGTILNWRTRFRVREVRYDPYQMQAVAQRLAKANVPMVEFAQTVGNLTEASNNLYELVKGGNLLAYPDAAIRLAVQRTVAVESSRGWKLDKSKQSHRIDVIVALAMAALAAVQGGVQGNWIGAVDWQRANAAVALAGAMRSVGITALEQRRLGI